MNVTRINTLAFLPRLVALLGILALIPLWLCMAILIKLDSPGTVFYRQTRVGKRKRLFSMLKFRSMLTSPGRDSLELTCKNDDRITPLGNTLRKYRLDELPQLWNIVKGEMCWIGPRPEQAYYVDKLLRKSASFESLYRVKPGITSLGMVKFGYARNIQEICRRAKYDKYYLQHKSLRLNLYIVLPTIRTICQGNGV